MGGGGLPLIFRFLNVGHGSSTIVELRQGAERHVGVIDSNVSGGGVPRALMILERLGVDKLSFLCLTHPHKDHFSGMYSIALKFGENINDFYSCPMGDLVQNKSRRTKLASHLVKIAKTTDGEAERNAAFEFVKILKWASEKKDSWTECAGEENRIAPIGFAGVDIFTVLPQKFSKGEYIQRIESNDPNMFGHIDDNNISLALKFSFAGVNVVLGGDAVASSWDRRRKYEAQRGQRLEAQVVNLPHHGSRRDSAPQVLENIFTNGGRRFGIVSANGRSHPSLDVIEWLETEDIFPFCTNLMAACGAKARKLAPLVGVDPELARVLRESATELDVPQVCQGDIELVIDESGEYSVSSEHNSFCGFRREFSNLFSPRSHE